MLFMRNLKPLLGLANADNHTLRIDQASSPLYSAFNRVSCVNTCGKVYCRYSEKTEFNSFFSFYRQLQRIWGFLIQGLYMTKRFTDSREISVRMTV